MTNHKKQDKKAVRLFIILFCGFFILLGGVFLTIGIVNIVNCFAKNSDDTIDYTERYSQVTAIVNDVKTEKHSHVEHGEWETDETMLIRITYEVDGKQYEGTLHQYRRGTKEGDRIDVYYDNSDPSLISLNLPGSDNKGNYGFGIFFVIFGLIWLFISVFCLVIGLRETAER